MTHCDNAGEFVNSTQHVRWKGSPNEGLFYISAVLERLRFLVIVGIATEYRAQGSTAGRNAAQRLVSDDTSSLYES